MAEKPALYRIFRLGDAVTLGLVALALTTTMATAARTEVRSGADPSAAGRALAYQRADRSGVLRDGGQTTALPGQDPAIGGPYAAVISGGNEIRILNRSTRRQLGVVGAPGAESVAISRGWLAYLTLRDGRYVLMARRLKHPANPGQRRRIATVRSPAQIGHPSVDGGRVFYAVSKRRGSSIKRRNLKSGKGGTVVRSRTAALSNPSARGKRLLYVRAKRARQGPQVTRAPKLRQSLMLKRIRRKGPGRRIYSRGEARQLWSTSLTAKRGFVTLLGRGGPRIISVRR